MTQLVPEEQNDLYIRALKALDHAGKSSEYHKPAQTKEEIELMKQTNHSISTSSFMAPIYKNGQYELIFANPLSTNAYLHDHETGETIDIQMWNSPSETLASLRGDN